MKYTKENEANKTALLNKLRAFAYHLRRRGYDVAAYAPLRPPCRLPAIGWTPSPENSGAFCIVYRYADGEKVHTLDLGGMSLAQLSDAALGLESLMREIDAETEHMQARVRKAIETVDSWLQKAEVDGDIKQDSE